MSINNQPPWRVLLSWVTMPLLLTGFGSLSGIKYQQFNFLAFFLLYLFAFSTLFLEKFLKKNGLKIRPPLLISGVIALICIGHFFIFHGFSLGILLLIFVLLVLAKPLFSYYQLNFLSSTISAIIKTYVLNIATAYAHTGFIDKTLLFLLSALLVPMLLYEINMHEKTGHSKTLFFISLIQYVGVIPFLLYQYGFLAFLLLIGFPYSFYMTKNKQLRSVENFLYINAGILVVIFINIYI